MIQSRWQLENMGMETKMEITNIEITKRCQTSVVELQTMAFCVRIGSCYM